MDICVIGVGGGTVCGQRKKQSIDEVVGSLLDIWALTIVEDEDKDILILFKDYGKY